MSSENPIPASSGASKVLLTAAGTPYIPLDTGSSAPIYLTPFFLTDVSTVQATLSDPVLAAQLIAVPQPYTLADAKYWINLQLEGKCNLPLQVLRASDPDAGQLVGSVSLMSIDSEPLALLRDKLPGLAKNEEKQYELGYYLHPDWTKKGIMTAGVKALVDWGRKEYSANVVIRVAEENTASRKIVEGMKGFVRDEARDSWVDVSAPRIRDLPTQTSSKFWIEQVN
jgi:RimJ/RimL family protein N-acetyltransferase